MNISKKILFASLLLSCASIKLLCMDPNYMPMMMGSAPAPQNAIVSPNATNLDLAAINSQIEQVNLLLSGLSKNKSDQARAANAQQRRFLQSKLANLNAQKKRFFESKKIMPQHTADKRISDKSNVNSTGNY